MYHGLLLHGKCNMQLDNKGHKWSTWTVNDSINGNKFDEDSSNYMYWIYEEYIVVLSRCPRWYILFLQEKNGLLKYDNKNIPRFLLGWKMAVRKLILGNILVPTSTKSNSWKYSGVGFQACEKADVSRLHGLIGRDFPDVWNKVIRDHIRRFS